MQTEIKPAITWATRSPVTISSGLGWLTFNDPDHRPLRITNPSELASLTSALHECYEAIARNSTVTRDVFFGNCRLTISSGIRKDPRRIRFFFSNNRPELMLEPQIVYDLQRWLAYSCREKEVKPDVYDCTFHVTPLIGGSVVATFDNGQKSVMLHTELPAELVRVLLTEIATPFDVDQINWRLVTTPLDRDGVNVVKITSSTFAGHSLSFVNTDDGTEVNIECSRSTLARLAIGVGWCCQQSEASITINQPKTALVSSIDLHACHYGRHNLTATRGV